MKVGNTCDPFSQEWDDLLNVIMEKGKVTDVGKYTLSFRLLLNVRKYFFGFLTCKEYATYEVWVSNKTSNYATLMKKDGKYPLKSHKPNQDTMDKLHKLEQKLRQGSPDNVYSLPGV